MRYIRTKDGRILDTSNYKYNKKQHWFEERNAKIDHIGFHIFCWKDEYDKVPNCFGKLIVEQLDKNEVKQADTIEELCDGFVLETKCGGYYIGNLESRFGELMLIDYVHNTRWSISQGKVFGAIWTDKGLIYVAKMKGILPNGEIDWELL